MKNSTKEVYFATLFSIATCIAHAQVVRTWVSGVGDDNNQCTRVAPCKSLSGAYAKTPAGAEIDALDPGEFGPVSITTSVTIDGGSEGGIIATGGANAITINSPTAVVTLRNIAINGQGSGLTGVLVTKAKEVHIQHAFIHGFTGNGVDIEWAAGSYVISDSVIHDNVGAGTSGIFVKGGGATKLTVARSIVKNNTVGMRVGDSVTAAAQDSYFSNNVTTGVWSLANLGVGESEIILEHCVVSNNGGAGVLAGDASALAPSDFWLSNNEITNNVGTGVQITTNGHVFTFSNNRILQNAVDGCAGCGLMGLN